MIKLKFGVITSDPLKLIKTLKKWIRKYASTVYQTFWREWKVLNTQMLRVYLQIYDQILYEGLLMT